MNLAENLRAVAVRANMTAHEQNVVRHAASALEGYHNAAEFLSGYARGLAARNHGAHKGSFTTCGAQPCVSLRRLVEEYWHIVQAMESP